MSYRTRGVVAAMIAATMATGLAACTPSGSDGTPGDTGQPTPGSSDAVPQLTGEVRLFTPYPENYQIPLEAVATAYMADHPDTTITIEAVPYDGYQATLQTQFMGGGAADIVHLEPPALTAFTSAGYLEKLTTALGENAGDAPWSERFDPAALASVGAPDGENYALPWANIHMGQLTRTDLLAKNGLEGVLPDTWANQMKIAEGLEAGGQKSFLFGLQGNDAQLWWRLTPMINAGLRPFTDEINLLHNEGFSYDSSDASSISGEIYTADEQYVAFVKGITDPAKAPIFRDSYELLLKLKPFAQDPAEFTPEVGGERFMNGEVAFAAGTEASIPSRLRDAEEAGVQGSTMAFNAFPAVSEKDLPGLTEGPSNPVQSVRNVMAVNAKSENKDLAMDFLRFASSAEGQELMYASAMVEGNTIIGEPSAMVDVTYPEGSGLEGASTAAEMVPELTLFGFGMPPTYDQQDFDAYILDFEALWSGSIDMDEFLKRRSENNLAALERNLDLFADTIDQGFIDENT